MIERHHACAFFVRQANGRVDFDAVAQIAPSLRPLMLRATGGAAARNPQFCAAADRRRNSQALYPFETWHVDGRSARRLRPCQWQPANDIVAIEREQGVVTEMDLDDQISRSAAVATLLTATTHAKRAAISAARWNLHPDVALDSDLSPATAAVARAEQDAAATFAEAAATWLATKPYA